MQTDGDTSALSTDHKLNDASILSTCEALLRKLDCNHGDTDIGNWRNVGVGYQLLSDSDIIQQVTSQ